MELGEVCVDESKCHIGSSEAIDKIRGYIYHMSILRDATELKTYIDMHMEKITINEYRKIVGLE